MMNYTEDHIARAAWSYLHEGYDCATRACIKAVGAAPLLSWLDKGAEGCPPELLQAAQENKAKFDDLREQWMTRRERVDGKALLERAEKCGARFIIPSDDLWPENLCVMGQYEPIGLWVKGNAQCLEDIHARSVSIVGCRASSSYGSHMCASIAWELAQEGWTVISGAAFGIDAVAHTSALKAGGLTVAVTAGGLDQLYPASHEQLFASIAQSGAIVSLHPPGARPTRWRFLDRNRLIAGLSIGTAVIEAGLRSGALNTAKHARDMGKYLAAVPGSVLSETSAGTNRLIREGAQLVRSAADICELMGPLGATTVMDGPRQDAIWDFMNDDEKIVYDALPKTRGVPVANIARASGLSLSRTQVALGTLQMAGYVALRDGLWKRHGASGTHKEQSTQVG